MIFRIAIATILLSGVISLGCSDDESGSGASGLSCNRAYEAPADPAGLIFDATVKSGSGTLCAVSGADVLVEFGSTAEGPTVRIETLTPPSCAEIESYLYEYEISDSELRGVVLMSDLSSREYLGYFDFCQKNEAGGDYLVSLQNGSRQRGTWTYRD